MLDAWKKKPLMILPSLESFNPQYQPTRKMCPVVQQQHSVMGLTNCSLTEFEALFSDELQAMSCKSDQQVMLGTIIGLGGNVNTIVNLA